MAKTLDPDCQTFITVNHCYAYVSLVQNIVESLIKYQICLPPLPKIHTCASVSFTITCIDFTGVTYIRCNDTEKKVYIYLFTRATSRDVHLEVVTDLTMTFLLVFIRFTGT